MRNITKIRRNCKALSPIFATLILIAIAVIAGIVVYMFTSGTIAGLTSGGGAGSEKVAVQSAAYVTGTTPTISVIAQSTGGPAATVNGMILKNAAGNTVASISGTSLAAATGSSLVLTNGVLNTLIGTYTITTPGVYTVTLTTVSGGSFVSPSFSVA